METPPGGPETEKDASQPQQWEKDARQTLEGTTQCSQQPRSPLTEACELGMRPDPARKILENSQGTENLVSGLEGDSDKAHEPIEEKAEPSDLWYCPDGSFVKKILTRGRGLDKPKLGSHCRVLVLKFPIGSGLPEEGWTDITIGAHSWSNQIWGELIEKCLESMRQGEEAEIRLPEHHGPLVRLTLDLFTPGRDSWELEKSEKEALAREHKARGTEMFRAGNPEGAARCYGSALRMLLTLPPPGPPERTVLHANLAACQLLLGQPGLAAQSCDRVLEREPRHLKALYRRGVAHAALGNLEKATEDLKKVLAADPQNRAAREELGKVVIQGKKQDAGLAQGLRKMFG